MYRSAAPAQHTAMWARTESYRYVSNLNAKKFADTIPRKKSARTRNPIFRRMAAVVRPFAT